MAPHPPTVWDGVLRRLHTEMPDYALDAWVRPLRACVEPDRVRLFAPSTFHQRRVETRFLALIERCFCAELGTPVRAQVVVEPATLPVQPAETVEPPAQRAIEPAAMPAQACGEQSEQQRPHPRVEAARAVGSSEPRSEPLVCSEPSPIQLSLPHRFDTFVVGPPNALAREAALAVARSRQPGVSPLFLAGPSGTGKSHLARALVIEARRHGAGRTVYASAEGFTSQLMTSIRGQSTRDFKRRYRTDCDLLVIEDVQFLEGKAATQLELFHTIEHLRMVGRNVVLTGDRLPRDIPRLDPRLSSEMASGLVAMIEPPDASLRREILRDKAAAGGVRLPADCLDLLVERVRGSVRDLEGVLRQIVACASLLGQPIDRKLTEEALRKVSSADERTLKSIDQVIDAVAGFFGLAPHALASPSRSHRVLLPRQLAMYLCHRYTDASLAEIGRALGREHPAVRNALRKIDREILERAPLRYQVEALAARIEGRDADSN